MSLHFEEIATARCRIAPLQPPDAAELQAITDETVTSAIHFLPEPFTLADARALIGQNGAENQFLGIRRQGDGDLLGVIGVHSRSGRSIEIGYWLAAAARGRGFAQETVREVIARLSAQSPGRLIVAECHPANTSSWALLRSLGFFPTGKAGERPGRALLAWHANASARIDVC